MHKWYPTPAHSEQPARHHEDDEREMEDEDEISQRAIDHVMPACHLSRAKAARTHPHAATVPGLPPAPAARTYRQGGDTLTRTWKSLREEAGANRKATIQGLRHRVATQLKHSGVEEVRIAELLGHANASIATGRYGKRFDVVALREVVERIDNRGLLAALFE